MKPRIFSPYAFLLILAYVIAAAPLLLQGFPKGHDWIFELVRIAEYNHALADGQYPPYWGGNLYGDYGSPIFLFYAPLFLFVSSLFAGLFDSFVTGGTAALLFFLFIAIFTVGKMMRTVLADSTMESQAGARVAIYFFLLNPYLLGNMLIRNADAEFTGMCLAPLALAGLLLINTDRRRGAILLAAGLGLTIIAHNLTALVTMAMVISAALALYLPKKSTRLWGGIAGGLVLGLVLAAFFWVPALVMKSAVQTDQLLIGKFDFHNQFQPLKSFFGHSQFFSTGFFPILLGISCRVGWQIRKQNTIVKRLLYFGLGCAVIFLFLQTRASIFLWEKIPFLPLFQFPWRFMGPLALVAAILAGICFARLFSEKSKKTLLIGEIVVLILCIFNGLPQLLKYKPLGQSISARLPEILTEQGIRKSFQTATVMNEYLPSKAQPFTCRLLRPANGPVIKTEPPAQVIVRANGKTEIELKIKTAESTRVRIARWFFQGWRCIINESVQEIQPNKYGSIDIPIPTGRNKITLEMRPPRVRVICLWFSLVGLVVFILMTTGVIANETEKPPTNYEH